MSRKTSFDAAIRGDEMSTDDLNSVIYAIEHEVENAAFDLAKRQPTAERRDAVERVRRAIFDAMCELAERKVRA